MKKGLLTALTVLLCLPLFAQDDREEENNVPGDFLDLFDNTRETKDVRTKTDLFVAFGWNQALGDDNGIGDDYRFWGSGIFDVGLEFNTRLQENDDLFRMTYGLNFRTQSLRINGNRQFATFDDVTNLAPTGIDIDRSRFRQFSLVAPLHLEIGRRDVKEYDNGVKRYGSGNGFVVGVGGYLGYTTTSTQELKFENDGRNVTNTRTNDYEINAFNYGLSFYAGWDHLQFFALYGLNDMFKDSPLQQQQVSFGIRLR